MERSKNKPSGGKVMRESVPNLVALRQKSLPFSHLELKL